MIMAVRLKRYGYSPYEMEYNFAFDNINYILGTSKVTGENWIICKDTGLILKGGSHDELKLQLEIEIWETRKRNYNQIVDSIET
jgi:hypothetical protein